MSTSIVEMQADRRKIRESASKMIVLTLPNGEIDRPDQFLVALKALMASYSRSCILRIQ